MGPGSSAEIPALHDASKTTALGCPDHINFFPGLEDIDTDRLANLEFTGVVGRNLAEVPAETAVLQVAAFGLVPPFDVAESQLDRFVAVGLLGLHLGDNARTGLNNCHGNHPSVFTEDLSHPYFLSQESLEHL
jgi:hypothetical protein